MTRYYPLVRGRQADLLALTASLNTGLSPRIIPILEPVRDVTALPRTVAAFARAQHPLFVITNPQVGHYGLLAHPRFGLPPLTGVVAPARYFDPVPAPLVIATTKAQVRLATAADTLVVPAEARMRQLRRPNAVYLSDHTPWREHTADFYTLQTEFYQYPVSLLPGRGFADYPLSTARYDERGYPQRAIAFHLLFAAHDCLYVRHFVSVNNADFRDPGVKFFEALAPLRPWLAAHPTANTPATAALLALQAQHHYPGLATLRKLQLEHWFTVMGRWLERGKTR